LPRGRGPAWGAGRDGKHPDARWPDPAARLPGSGAMTGSRPEPHTLAGAYAMDALDGQDRARFERHLERCEEGTREVAGLHEATTRMAGAAAVPPPAPRRGLLLAQPARTRQLPPVTHSASPATARRAPAAPDQRLARLRVRLRAPRLAVVLAGVAVLAAVAVWAGGTVVRSSPPAPSPVGHDV